MKEQSWHTVLIMVWRRILGEGLITAHTRDKKGPCSIHSSSPSPPPATGSVLFCSAQQWPPVTTVCQTQGSVFCPPLTRSQQRGTLVTAHSTPHISPFVFGDAALSWVSFRPSSLEAPFITSDSQPDTPMSTSSVFSPQVNRSYLLASKDFLCLLKKSVLGPDHTLCWAPEPTLRLRLAGGLQAFHLPLSILSSFFHPWAPVCTRHMGPPFVFREQEAPRGDWWGGAEFLVQGPLWGQGGSLWLSDLPQGSQLLRLAFSKQPFVTWGCA